MPGKVLLNMIAGDLAGKRYRFDSQMLCLVGRADNCSIQLTGTAGEGVSRHHCMLNIRPPCASVQDLGSRNGTFINERPIGRSPEAAGSAAPPFVELADGDHIRLANNIFEVRLIRPIRCYVCHKILPDGFVSEEELAGGRSAREIICNECHAAGLTHPVSPASKTLRVRTCVVCGAEVTLPAENAEPEGEFICPDCRMRHADPNSTFRIPEHNDLSSSLFTIRGYRVLKRIGRGGMGEVFLAQNSETLEKVAVKVLRPEIASYDSCRADFLREAENLKPLKHPNIVELKDCLEDGDSVYLVLEYCSGGTLRTFLRKRGRPFDARTALDFTYQILDALDYAHNIRIVQTSFLDDQEYTINGLVHRDIKPENIFVSVNEGIPSAKISDFGLAKAFEMAGLSGCTRTGDFSGTLGFISKQQFINYKYARPEVDVWAAAATLYFMLTGAPPRDFSTGDPVRIFETRPIPVGALNSEISAPLAKVIDDALNDTSSLRYKTATSLKFALLDAENRS